MTSTTTNKSNFLTTPETTITVPQPKQEEEQQHQAPTVGQPQPKQAATTNDTPPLITAAAATPQQKEHQQPEGQQQPKKEEQTKIMASSNRNDDTIPTTSSLVTAAAAAPQPQQPPKQQAEQPKEQQPKYQQEEQELVWDDFYQQLIDFRSQHGHLIPPLKDKAYAKLALWTLRQRQWKKKGILSKDYISKLDKIHFPWECGSTFDVHWLTTFLQLKTFYQQYGHCNPDWLPQLQQHDEEEDEAYEKNKGKDKRRRQEKQSASSSSYETLIDWCDQQRKDYFGAGDDDDDTTTSTTTMMSQERIDRLNSIHFLWKPTKYDLQWEERFQRLKRHLQKQQLLEQQQQQAAPNHSSDYTGHNKDLSYSSSFAFPVPKNMNQWIREQKRNYTIGRLAPYKALKFQSIGCLWTTSSADGQQQLLDGRWVKKYERLQIFQKKFGHCSVPQSYGDNSLVAWVVNQRTHYNNGRMEQERIDKLNEIGFVWSSRPPGQQQYATEAEKQGNTNANTTSAAGRVVDKNLEIRWNQQYQLLQSYKNEYGDCNVPKRYAGSDYSTLPFWVRTQRESYRQNKISQERIDKLNQIGFTWLMKRGYTKQMRAKKSKMMAKEAKKAAKKTRKQKMASSSSSSSASSKKSPATKGTRTTTTTTTTTKKRCKTSNTTTTILQQHTDPVARVATTTITNSHVRSSSSSSTRKKRRINNRYARKNRSLSWTEDYDDDDDDDDELEDSSDDDGSTISFGESSSSDIDDISSDSGDSSSSSDLSSDWEDDDDGDDASNASGSSAVRVVIGGRLVVKHKRKEKRNKKFKKKRLREEDFVPSSDEEEQMPPAGGGVDMPMKKKPTKEGGGRIFAKKKRKSFESDQTSTTMDMTSYSGHESSIATSTTKQTHQKQEVSSSSSLLAKNKKKEKKGKSKMERNKKERPSSSGLEKITEGCRISVYWPDDDEWYEGVATQIKKDSLFVEYDDMEKEWLDLKTTAIRFLSSSSHDASYDYDGHNSKNNHNTKNKVASGASKRRADDLTVGTRVSIWWPAEKEYFDATVTKISGDVQTKKPHFVEYDDGDKEWINLNFRNFKVLSSVADLIIGSRVSVWWDSENQFYKGQVKKILTSDHTAIARPHLVIYDDGDSEWTDLSLRLFTIL